MSSARSDWFEEEMRRRELAAGAGPRPARVEGAGARLQRLREEARAARVTRGELAAAWAVAAGMGALALGTWLWTRRRAGDDGVNHYLHGVDVVGAGA